MDILNNKEALLNKHVFYRAVVEDRNDPEKINRVRVRIMGIHPVNASSDLPDPGVPTEILPWAEIAAPALHGGQNSGIGITSVPLKGTWVWVFLDAGDWAKPIIIGTMYGIPRTERPDGPKTTWGFNDPDKKYPIKSRLNEPDTNRLSNQINFSKTSISLLKIESRERSIATCSGKTWDEPEEKSSKAKYPDNTVIETISGNIIEYDDTVGNSRIHMFHKSGSYFEMRDNGDFSTKIRTNKYEIINNNTYKLVKDSDYTTIRNNSELKIDGNLITTVGGSMKETVNGSLDEVYGSSKNETVKGQLTNIYMSAKNETVRGSVTNTYSSSKVETVSGSVSETYSGGLSTNAGGSMVLKAGIIKLN